MADDRRPAATFHEDPELDGLLTSLAPTVRAQEWAEAQAPAPEFVDRLRRRLTGRIRRRRRRVPRAVVRGVVLLAVLAILAILIAAAVRYLPFVKKGTVTPPRPVFALPVPRSAELTKSYPTVSLPGAPGPAGYTTSRVALPAGSAYRGRLTLRDGQFPALPSHVAGFRLQAARNPVSAEVVTLAGQLGIAGKPATVRGTSPIPGTGAATFAVVAQGAQTTAGPLHSIAVSTIDGTIVYHNTTYRGAGATAPIQPATAQRVARRWLTTLGWPGNAMGVMNVVPVPGVVPPGRVRAVSFTWPGIARSDLPAAVVWVNSAGRVTEALVFPRQSKQGRIPLRTVASAWRTVQVGRVPIGVTGAMPRAAVPGTGRRTAVSIEHILTSGRGGRLSLVPAYRFSGTVRLRGVTGTRQWIALVPAARSP